MEQRKRGPGIAAFAAAAALIALAGLPAVAQSMWVLGESEQIFVLDTRTLTLDPNPIPLGGFANIPPTCMTFSSTPGSPVAFITHDRFVRMVDVKTRQLLPHVIDVAALIGVQDIDLQTCAAAAPRQFAGGQFFFTRSHLFLAGSLPGGEVRWVVLDQRQAILNGQSVLVKTGRLHLSARVLDVKVLDASTGDAYQQAWYTLGDSEAGHDLILNTRVALQQDLNADPIFGPTETLTLPTVGLPQQGVGIGTSFDGKLPVQPGFNSGRLTSLETGLACTIPANPASVSVHGIGPNSYSVFALDPLANDLVAINPNDCSTIAYDVGAGPVAMVPRRGQVWDGMFVLNRDGDSISFLDPAGNLSTLPLPADAGPIGGGLAESTPCVADNLLLDKSGNDIVLTWDAIGCDDQDDFSAWCNCVDTAIGCPCTCDCTVPSPDPACSCPFAEMEIGFKGGGLKGTIDGFLLDYNPGDVPTQNPWKKLESTPGTTIDHEGVLGEGSWFYLISRGEDPPDP